MLEFTLRPYPRPIGDIYGCRLPQSPTVDVIITAFRFRRLCESPEGQNHLVPISRLQPADLRCLSGFGRSCRTSRFQYSENGNRTHDRTESESTKLVSSSQQQELVLTSRESLHPTYTN
eukprot:7110464-Prymnesium_polylepis.1